MIDVTNLVRIEYHGERILTTKQLAEFYGCTPYNIRTNFNANKEQFEEGIHYFKLEGEQLRAFKAYVGGVMAKNSHIRNPYAPLTRLASSIILWTKAGCVRHCKMLGTPKAWEVFNILEINYFEGATIDPIQIDSPPDAVTVNIDKLELLALTINVIDKYGADTIERILEKWIKLLNR